MCHLVECRHADCRDALLGVPPLTRINPILDELQHLLHGTEVSDEQLLLAVNLIQKQ
jgi:hypothetical protein